MHGLINRSIQSFLRDTYGLDLWDRVAADAGLGPLGFEALLSYDDALTEAVLTSACRRLDKPREVVLEDLGTYLVTSPNVRALRRLLRFGGETFVEFLHSLEDLHERGRLAVADLSLPVLELRVLSMQSYTLDVIHPYPGFGHVSLGVLRAMADDYGTLAILEFQGREGKTETLGIECVDIGFSAGKEFALAAGDAA